MPCILKYLYLIVLHFLPNMILISCYIALPYPNQTVYHTLSHNAYHMSPKHAWIKAVLQAILGQRQEFLVPCIVWNYAANKLPATSSVITATGPVNPNPGLFRPTTRKLTHVSAASWHRTQAKQEQEDEDEDADWRHGCARLRQGNCDMPFLASFYVMIFVYLSSNLRLRFELLKAGATEGDRWTWNDEHLMKYDELSVLPYESSHENHN